MESRPSVMVWFVLKYFSAEVIQVEFSDPVAASDVKRYRRFAGADSQVIWWAAPTGNVRVHGASGASGIPAGRIQRNRPAGDVRKSALFPLSAAHVGNVPASACWPVRQPLIMLMLQA